MSTKSKSAAPSPGVADTEFKAFIPPAPKIEFLTDPKSPFRDKYSIELEKAFLADFMSQEFMDEKDPLYERWIELDDRMDRLAKMQSQFKTRKGAEFEVEPKEYFGMNELGSLVDDEVDQMSLHTKEAYRMFMGRAKEPGKDTAPITGGKRVASALKALWTMTANDNPYADWFLIVHEKSMEEVHARLQREIKESEKHLSDQQNQGLRYSVLRSANPKVLNLGFKSPYGYAIAELVSRYDYFVRVQKTLARKNLRSDDQVRQAITDITRFIRRVFNNTARCERWLMRDELKGLCRADFIPGSVEGAKRVEYASGVFEMVPSEVYTCKLQPRHSRRRIQISAAERKLMGSIGAELERKEKQAAQHAEGATPESDAGLL